MQNANGGNGQNIASQPFIPIDTRGLRLGESKLPGKDGIPVVGSIMNVRATDPPEARYQSRSVARSAQLDYSNHDDRMKYDEVGQMVCDGRATISYEERMYDEDIKSWRILLRWAEHYYVNPNESGGVR